MIVINDSNSNDDNDDFDNNGLKHLEKYFCYPFKVFIDLFSMIEIDAKLLVENVNAPIFMGNLLKIYLRRLFRLESTALFDEILGVHKDRMK